MAKPLFLLKEFCAMHRSAIVLIFIGFAVYANAFQNQMFWDDNDSILNNLYVHDWGYFLKYFTENLIAGAGFFSNFWRPILLSVFSLEWHLWGEWPAGYHFVSTAFHVANAVLIFQILCTIFQKRRVAFLTALIFLIHPLQTEAVTYVAGMADPLSVFFILLGIFFFLKFRTSDVTPWRSRFYLLSLLMYALALMSKETAIIMPALLVISDFFLERGDQEQISFKETLLRIWRTAWPFLVIGGLYFLLRATVLNFGDTFNLYGEATAYTSSFSIRIFTFFQVITAYFALLFWPVGLHMERSVDMATSFLSLPVISGALIFLGLIALAFTQFKRYPILSFGILWFFIGLAPTSNILIPINGLIYEHWLYLPMVGIFLIVIWLGEVLAEKYGVGKTLLLIFLIFVVFLSVLTIERNREWRDPITFYNQTLRYSPESYRVINNLGMAYADRHDYVLAEATYRRAIEVASSSPVAYHNLGNTYQKIGKTNLAIENFNTAIQRDPEFFFSYNALANLYVQEKNYTEARKVLEQYLNYSDSKSGTLFLLAQIAVAQKDYNSALDYLNSALLIDPANETIRSTIKDIRGLIVTVR
ncbi:MAG: tetratricopeptide repeat protein [bacterium]|nr:tetratricopeptide repeat protein [bacterium]